MSSRLSFLLNTNLKSGLKRGGRRSYATGHHQEQDPTPPSGSSTPFIVAGLVALGGIIYYSKTGKTYIHRHNQRERELIPFHGSGPENNP